MADQLVETAITPAVNAVAGDRQLSSATNDDRGINEMRGLLVQLTSLIKPSLERDRSSSRDGRDSRGSSARYSRSRSPSSGRSSRMRSQSPQHQGECYYHRRFGRDAHKCRPPCSYRESSPRGRAGNRRDCSQ